MRVLTTRKKIEWIAHKYKIATWLKADLLLNDISTDFRDRILNTPLFWRIPGERVCIALDLFVYITVSCREGVKVPIITAYVDTRKQAGKGTVVDRFVNSYLRRDDDERLGTEIQTAETF